MSRVVKASTLLLFTRPFAKSLGQNELKTDAGRVVTSLPPFAPGMEKESSVAPSLIPFFQIAKKPGQVFCRLFAHESPHDAAPIQIGQGDAFPACTGLQEYILPLEIAMEGAEPMHAPQQHRQSGQ